MSDPQWEGGPRRDIELPDLVGGKGTVTRWEVSDEEYCAILEARFREGISGLWTPLSESLN
jgi:hypothetical protein